MKKYTITVEESFEKPKKIRQTSNSNNSPILVLIIAIVVGLFISPDLIDLKTFIPKDKYENTNSL